MARGGPGWPRACRRSLTLACVVAIAPVDDPQRDRLRPPGADLQQRLDRTCAARTARRPTPARTSASGSSTASRHGGRQRGGPGRGLALAGPALARDHAGQLAVVVPVRILRTVSLYQPRRQVVFAEGRWVRGKHIGRRRVLPAGADVGGGRAGAAAFRHSAARPARPGRRGASSGRRGLWASAVAACLRAVADAARRRGSAVVEGPASGPHGRRERLGARPGGRRQWLVLALRDAGEQRPQLRVARLALGQAAKVATAAAFSPVRNSSTPIPCSIRASGLSR